MRTLFKLSFVAVIALSFNAGADEPKPQPVRTLFSHHDQSRVPGKEIVIGTAMLGSIGNCPSDVTDGCCGRCSKPRGGTQPFRL
jgi:hypothetical protein